MTLIHHSILILKYVLSLFLTKYCLDIRDRAIFYNCFIWYNLYCCHYTLYLSVKFSACHYIPKAVQPWLQSNLEHFHQREKLNPLVPIFCSCWTLSFQILKPLMFGFFFFFLMPLSFAILDISHEQNHTKSGLCDWFLSFPHNVFQVHSSCNIIF